MKFAADGRFRGYTAGEQMYYQLREHGYHAAMLGSSEMMQYVEHIAHATAGLRPDERQLHHRRSRKRVARKLHRFFNSAAIKELSVDTVLDE